MDEINAQEAAEAAAEAYEELMIARAGKEVERAAQVEAVEATISEFQSEMEWREEEVTTLQKLNKEQGITAAETGDNNEEIARLLGEYYDFDDKVLAEKKKLEAVKQRHL